MQMKAVPAEQLFLGHIEQKHLFKGYMKQIASPLEDFLDL
jgi:hypothetical protein